MHNTDDIFLRNLTISLIQLLNSTITYSGYQENTLKKINVPFSYNYGSNEGFLKDFYIGLPDECRVNFAEGTYDKYPLGIITLSNFQVSSADITNKFTRGNYTEVQTGENDEPILTALSARLYSIPLSVKFDIQIKCESVNQAFKIAESMLLVNFSNRVMYFQYNGLRIPAQFQFPTSESVKKPYAFSLMDDTCITIDLQVDVETYLPSFDQSSKLHSNNKIAQIKSTIKPTDTYTTAPSN